MYTDYIFYLNTLTEIERDKQILTIILIWTIMLLIAGIIEVIIHKARKK